MPHVPRRKRFKHRKRRSSVSGGDASSLNAGLNPAEGPSPGPSLDFKSPSGNLTGPSSDFSSNYSSSEPDSRPSSSISMISCETDASDRSVQTVDLSNVSVINNIQALVEDVPRPEGTEVTLNEPLEVTELLSAREQAMLLKQVHEALLLCLPPLWTPLLGEDKVYALMMSPFPAKAVQRSLLCSINGDFQLYVHCQEVDVDPFVKPARLQAVLAKDNVGYFVDRIVEVVNNVRSMAVCAGADNVLYRSVWPDLNIATVDKNPYQECRYSETCRSLICTRLVKASVWKCSECRKLVPFLKRRYQTASKEVAHPSTGNRYLSKGQTLIKLKKCAEDIEKQRKKIDYMHSRMLFLINKEGCTLDENMSEKLMDLLQAHNLSPAQSMFLQQQIKASHKTKMCGMRWHPSMINIALAIHLTSPAAYRLMQESGIVSLPSTRTLFDFSHEKNIKEGIDEVALKSAAEKVDNLIEENEEKYIQENMKILKKRGDAVDKASLKEEARQKFRYFRYHVLMGDEMHISKNLVFQKSTGELIGYVKLNSLDAETLLLENYLTDPDQKAEFVQASKMMVYLVKGIASNVKEVVASYAVHNISPKQMYDWTWQVIGALERSGIWLVSYTCDASSVNRAFIKLHTPATSGCNVVFDCVNRYAPHRKLYFFSDVPHLLKTIRNCFNNSRLKKRGKRCLQKNSQKIVWDHIISLYNHKKGKNLRRAYKLNTQNVFPDSYSCMRVGLACQIMSRTVAFDLKKENIPKSEETIKFITWVNDWFDCLNGAHSSQGKKKKNYRLNPYTSVDDSRFKFIMDFVEYLYEWKREAESCNVYCESVGSADSTVNAEELDDPTEALCPVEDVDEIDDTPAAKRQLSHQTILGIEMSVRAFIGVTTFLLEQGTQFVNSRIFCQDPLEQYFSKQRAGGGGSTNPNVQQFQQKQRSIHMLGQVGLKRKGNCTEGQDGRFQVSNDPLPKRK